MKISIMVTLDVDPEQWDIEYRCGRGRGAVREDVLSDFRQLVNSMVEHDDLSPAVRSVSVRPTKRSAR